MSSCLYNAAALGAAFLLTATSRTNRARLLLLTLVCLNFYLERKIYQYVTSSDLPEHQHMEVVSLYISYLRRVVLSVSLSVLLIVFIRHTDPLQQSLMVLEQLQQTQRSLQVALQHAESLGEKRRSEEYNRERKTPQKQNQEKKKRQENVSAMRRKQEEPCPIDQSELSQLSHIGWSPDRLLSSTVCSSAADNTVLAYNSHDATVTHAATVQDDISHDTPALTPALSPSRCQRRSSRRVSAGSPLVYSILVKDKQSRYSLRSRRSETSRYFD